MFKERIVDYSQDWSTLVYKTDGYATIREAMDKVGCSICPVLA